MVTPSDRNVPERPKARDASQPRSDLEVARRIAREALEADRQAVEVDARFAFKVISHG
jgi:hypothetical protein